MLNHRRYQVDLKVELTGHICMDLAYKKITLSLQKYALPKERNSPAHFDIIAASEDWKTSQSVLHTEWTYV